jgi:hypothetical protein
MAHDGTHRGSYWAAAIGPDGRVTEWQWRCGLCSDGVGIVDALVDGEQAASDALDAHLATHDDDDQ